MSDRDRKRIFLDVGAHDGQTLQEAALWGFDAIYALEPMPEQFGRLVEVYGENPIIHLLNYGLSSETRVLPVYGSNEDMEASVYPGAEHVDADVVTECLFVEAAEFFWLNLAFDDLVVVKLNCEGSEVDILGNLIDTGEIWKASTIMVDFDVRKIPDQRHTEGPILGRLAQIGFDRFNHSAEVLLGETHQERISTWLGWLTVQGVI